MFVVVWMVFELIYYREQCLEWLDIDIVLIMNFDVEKYGGLVGTSMTPFLKVEA